MVSGIGLKEAKGYVEYRMTAFEADNIMKVSMADNTGDCYDDNGK